MRLMPRFKLDWREGRGIDLDVAERVGRLSGWKAIPLTGRTKSGRRRKSRKGASFRL